MEQLSIERKPMLKSNSNLYSFSDLLCFYRQYSKIYAMKRGNKKIYAKK